MSLPFSGERLYRNTVGLLHEGNFEAILHRAFVLEEALIQTFDLIRYLFKMI